MRGVICAVKNEIEIALEKNVDKEYLAKLEKTSLMTSWSSENAFWWATLLAYTQPCITIKS